MQCRAIAIARRALLIAMVAPMMLCLAAIGTAQASDPVCLSAVPAAYSVARPPDPHRGWMGGLYHRIVSLAGRVKKASLKVMMINRPDPPAPLPPPPPTDAERYRAATGRSLPAVHGLITLPPATPHGDYTYIWAVSAKD